MASDTGVLDSTETAKLTASTSGAGIDFLDATEKSQCESFASSRRTGIDFLDSKHSEEN